MNLGLIRNLCEKRAGGMRQLASDIGMSEANLHRCVNNNKIQATDLEQIALKLRVDIRQFFDDEVRVLANNTDTQTPASMPIVDDNRELITPIMHIGLKIRELMSKEKMDVPTLAKKMDRTKQAVYDMLEKEDVSTAILKKLSGIFKVPVTYFLTDEEQENCNQEELDLLRQEVVSLKEEIQRLKDLKLPNRNDRLYDLWMQFMRNQAQHQEIMKEMAAIYGEDGVI